MLIAFSKLNFCLEAQTDIILPPFKGATLRGGFGRSLRKITCALRRKSCLSCILRVNCAYSYIFETGPTADSDILHMSKYERIPHPFVLEPPRETKMDYPKGSEISFSLILVGKAIDYAAYYVLSFAELGKDGIGRRKGKYRLSGVVDEMKGESVFDPETQTLQRIQRSYLEIPEIAPSEEGKNRVTLSLESPLRLKFRRQLVSQLEFHMLIRNLLRRLTLLYYFHCERRVPNLDVGGLIKRSETVRTVESSLRWYDINRYSSRQRSKLKMGGLIGSITFEGNLNPFIPILAAGEVLHAGTGTSFGLGKYRMTVWA